MAMRPPGCPAGPTASAGQRPVSRCGGATAGAAGGGSSPSISRMVPDAGAVPGVGGARWGGGGRGPLGGGRPGPQLPFGVWGGLGPVGSGEARRGGGRVGGGSDGVVGGGGKVGDGRHDNGKRLDLIYDLLV